MIRNCRSYYLNINKICFGDCSYFKNIIFNKINCIILYYNISAVRNSIYKKFDRTPLVTDKNAKDCYFINNIMLSLNFHEEDLFG